MKLDWLDITTLVVYLGGMALMGVYFARKNKNTEEYFVGGRAFKGWVIGLSLVGTSISSVTFLAFPADAFKTSWVRFPINFALLGCVFIAAYVFLPFFRRGKITSAYQYLEGRFGPSIRVYASSAFIIAQLIRVSVVLYLFAIVIQNMTDLNPTVCILIGGGFVALYTILGGIDAVIWTDVIQTIVLVVGGVVALAFIVYKLPGGLEQIFSVASEDHKLAFAELADGKLKPISWGLSLQKKTVLMMLLVGFSSFLYEYSGNQNVIQRYCASKSAHEARKAIFVCAFSSVPIWAFFMFLGTSLYVFFKVFPTPQTTEILAGTRDAEQVLPFFIINYMPPGLTGLLIAAALAAAMSSLDSSINAISAVGVVDIYQRHLVKGRDDAHYLWVARLIACVAGVFMIGGAIVLAYSDSNTIQDTITILASLVAGGVLGMYLLGFLTNKGDARAVWIGIIFTIIFTSWTVLNDRGLLPDFLSVKFDLYYTGLIGNILMFAIGFLAGTLLPERKRDLTNLTVWHQDGTPLD